VISFATNYYLQDKEGKEKAKIQPLKVDSWDEL
jgi:hypothetical protein